MATWRIKYVARPQQQDTATGEFADADYLRVHAVSDTDQEVVMTLDFDANAGLQTEFEAGLAVTVLTASVNAVLDSAETPDEALPPAIKGGKELYEYTP